MKIILKNLGIIMIVLAALIMCISIQMEQISNVKLAISGLLIFVGFFTYIGLNKLIE